MMEFAKNKPVIREKSNINIFLIVILSILGVSLVLLPVVVNFMNGFSATESAADVIYYILRGLFGVSVAVCASFFAVKKDAVIFTIPGIIGFITVLFPFINSIYDMNVAMNLAKEFSMQIGYRAHILEILKYLIYTLLCVFTVLYCTGLNNSVTIITLLSVISALGTFALSLETYMTYDISAYQVLCESDGCVVSIIPLVILFTTKPNVIKKKPQRYKARRMR